MKKVSIVLAVLSLIFTTGFSTSAQGVKESSKFVRSKKLPVEFGKIRAFTDGRGVWLEWQMTSETDNLGFTVEREINGGGKKEIVNRGLISGAYTELGEKNSAGRKYSFFDAAGDSTSVYTIESLSGNGDKSSSRRVNPTVVGDLSEITGISSETFRASAETSNPTVQRSENNLPVAARAASARNAPQADDARQLWVAAQPGVKIGVRRDGIYRVSRDQLKLGGFNVSASSDLWQLYVNGVEQSINIGANDDYVEFYGRTIDTSEANTQIYYLVVGTAAGKRMVRNNRRQLPGRVSAANFDQSVIYKERLNYTSNILNGDAENFFGSVITNSGTTVTINLAGVDFSSAESSLDVVIQGLTTVQHRTRVAINGHEVGTLDTFMRDSSNAHFDIPTSYLVEGANRLQLNTINGSGDISYFDTVKINYLRKFQAENNALSFFVSPLRSNFVDNFTSQNIRVFDITNSDAPALLTGLSIEPSNVGAYRVFLPLNRGRQMRAMYAIEDSAILAPATLTPNQTSSLAAANHNADLVIVTYKNWALQASDWAAYRRAQGMSVEVVDIEDVYDEFSFGAVSSLSIRNFLQNAVAKWQGAPKYVLLIGDATYDPKNYFGAGYNSFIPTRLIDTVYTESSSDDSLADFNDDGLSEIAIGRIPAKSAAYVTQQLNKVASFEQMVARQNGLSRGAIFASDVPNGYDFASLSERVRQQLPQSVPSVMINRTETDARSRLLSEVNAGRFLVNYSGHGTTNAWVDFFGNGDALQMSNDNLSIFTMLTCLNGFFISPNQSPSGDGLAEALLTTQKGAVASWASSGLTTPDVQEIMATRFYQQIGIGNISRLGDLVKDAKTEINGGRDVRLSWVLLGDPTLKVR